MGVVRSRRWAEKRARRPLWAIALRMLPVLPSAVLFACYPAGVSLISNGREITWDRMVYFALPLTLTLVVGAASGLATAFARALRLRAVRSGA